MTISNNGFMATITVKSDMYPGDRREPCFRTSFTPRRYREPDIIPLKPVKGLELSACISAGLAYVYGTAKEYIPAGSTGTYFLVTGERNVKIEL